MREILQLEGIVAVMGFSLARFVINMSHCMAVDIVSLATTHVSPTLRSTG